MGNDETQAEDLIGYEEMMRAASKRAIAIELAHEIRRAMTPGSCTVMDRLKWTPKGEERSWLEMPDREGFAHCYATLSSDGKRAVVLCSVDKLNNLPEGLGVSYQAMLPGCEEGVGIPAILFPDGKMILCPLDVHW